MVETNYQKVNRLLHRLGGVYRDPSRVINDATSLLNSVPGQHLNPDISDLLHNDGTNMRGLRLSGTISMIYRSNTYHIPIDLFLPPNYSVRPPIIFVRPVSSMMIKQGHRHVAADGMVYMPYLHSWRSGTHNLIDTVTSMSRIFGEDPPVYARSNAAPVPAPAPTPIVVPTPPPPRYHDVRPSQEEQERLRQLERDAQEANEAVRIAREAERKEAEENRLQGETRQRLVDKSKYLMESYTDNSKKELEVYLEHQILLNKSASYVTGSKGVGTSNNDGQIEYFTKKKAELEKHHAALDESIEKVREFIKEAEKSKKSTKEMDVDELAKPADIHSAQMLVLSAENAAIEDALYYLGKGLSGDRLTLDVHLKVVRRLAKRQFLIKAHLLKIGQVKAAECNKGRGHW